MPDYASCLTQLPVDILGFIARIFVFAAPQVRAVHSWSYTQAVKVHLLTLIAKYAAYLNLKTAMSLEPGKEGKRFIVAKPASDKVYDGPTRDNIIRPGPVGLTWYPSVPTTATLTSSSVVALNLHGGAYAMFTGRDADSGFAAKILHSHLGCSFVCSPSYRVSTSKGDHFPAALQDAITAYLHLVKEMRIPPSQIVLSGDSAGANLALALLRYIDEYGGVHDIPLLIAATLWSPWVDINDALVSRVESKANSPTDYLSTAFVQWGASMYTKNGAIDPTQPYISPLLHPFSLRRGKVPVWIHAGDREVLLDDIVQMAKKLELAGWPVKLHVSPGCPHDVFLCGDALGFEVEAAGAAKEAKNHLRTVTKLQFSG
ncbi:alpha/beta-hydrolase [Sarocladium strictum]